MKGAATVKSAGSPPAAPFDYVAETYDRTFTFTLIGWAQRQAVWRELDRVFQPGQRILELNCGTGVDALHLGGRGVEVLACDVAPRMIEVARRRLSARSTRARVEFRVLATEQMRALRNERPFDGAFSNFAGLNCVADLESVARDLAPLLRPGATALLCLAGRFVAWEIAWYLAHGNPAKALRRFRRGAVRGRLADGVSVPVYYHGVRKVARLFSPGFRLRRWKGVGLLVPPSYLERQAGKFPRLFRLLAGADRLLAGVPGLRALADHLLLEFERA
jgi:ubiquinone/menaquinone biosynthesis C-methylase UbiE